jgi:hypothetical protein
MSSSKSSKELEGKLKTAPHLEIKLLKCNDLAAKDANGLSDPVSVTYECHIHSHTDL